MGDQQAPYAAGTPCSGRPCVQLELTAEGGKRPLDVADAAIMVEIDEARRNVSDLTLFRKRAIYPGSGLGAVPGRRRVSGSPGAFRFSGEDF